MGKFGELRAEFVAKLGNELWKFAGKCKPKAKCVVFSKVKNTIVVKVKAGSGWHRVKVCKRYVSFSRGKIPFLPKIYLKYYRWCNSDDHDDVVDHFVSDLKIYHKALFPGKGDDKYFNYLYQSYGLQKYIEKLEEEEGV